jgi:hypothetical protein
MSDEESSWVMLVRGQGKTRGAIGFALNFFAPLFSFKRKKWKTSTCMFDEKSKDSYSNASPGSA